MAECLANRQSWFAITPSVWPNRTDRLADRGSEREEDPFDGRCGLHRHRARAPAGGRERARGARQPAPRLADRHRPGRAREPALRPGRRARSAVAARADRARHARRPPGRDRRCRLGAEEPGAHDAGQPPRHLERARGRAGGGLDRAADRLLDQRGLRHACLQGRGDARHLAGLGRRGALDVCGLEAGRRVPGALVLRRVQAARYLDPAVQRLRPGPARQRRDPPLHRSRARRRGDRDPRRRLADPRLVLRRRRRRGAARDARARGGGRPGLQRRQPALGGDRLRPRLADQAAGGVGVGDRLQAAALHRRRDADPERRQGAEAARVGAARRPGRRARPHDRVVPRAAARAEPGAFGVKLILAAAVVLVATVPGAAARQAPVLRISLDRPVFSPNGNGVNDTVAVRTNAARGTLLGLRVYAWGGRLAGWKRIRTGVSSTSPDLTWNGTTAGGRAVRDGTYQVTVCYKDQGRPQSPRGVVRPGLAEASVRRPPWRTTGCAPAHTVRVERLAAFVDSTGSFHHGDRMPLVVSADRGQATTALEDDCSGATGDATRPGLYHEVVRDPAGDRFFAPVVVRRSRPLDKPAPHTALV